MTRLSFRRYERRCPLLNLRGRDSSPLERAPPQANLLPLPCWGDLLRPPWQAEGEGAGRFPELLLGMSWRPPRQCLLRLMEALLVIHLPQRREPGQTFPVDPWRAGPLFRRSLKASLRWTGLTSRGQAGLHPRPAPPLPALAKLKIPRSRLGERRKGSSAGGSWPAGRGSCQEGTGPALVGASPTALPVASHQPSSDSSSLSD